MFGRRKIRTLSAVRGAMVNLGPVSMDFIVYNSGLRRDQVVRLLPSLIVAGTVIRHDAAIPAYEWRSEIFDSQSA